MYRVKIKVNGRWRIFVETDSYEEALWSFDDIRSFYEAKLEEV